MTEPQPGYDTARTVELAVAQGCNDMQVLWAHHIDAVRAIASQLVGAQSDEDHALRMLGQFKATTLAEAVILGTFTGSNERVRKAQEEQWLETHCDYQELLTAHHAAGYTVRKAEVELEYARLRERFWRQVQATDGSDKSGQ